MAEEKNNSQGKNSGSGNRKRSRRRYFKRKKSAPNDGSGSESGGAQKDSGGAQKDSGGEQQSRSRPPRNRRRRRRSRSGSDNSSDSGSAPMLELDYTPPESVFVYTHVLRPEQRDSYSFRSEISSGTGRTLADFDIDLSLLFPDESKQAGENGEMAGKERPVDRQAGDQDIESTTDEQIPDETAQANHFQSEDDKPSSFV